MDLPNRTRIFARVSDGVVLEKGGLLVPSTRSIVHPTEPCRSMGTSPSETGTEGIRPGFVSKVKRIPFLVNQAQALDVHREV